MTTRHKALLVEDDQVMAEVLAELLEAIGHESVHVTNLEDAARVVAGGGFCYVLLDLEIKTKPDSIRARTEAGAHVLELVREHYPAKGKHSVHKLPVIVISGHASELEHVVSSMREGADDFLPKPIGALALFREKIRETLLRSGRDKHELCATATREARDGRSLLSRLAIPGREEGKKIEVVIDDRPILLTHASFVLLLRLVHGRLERPADGWVHKTNLGAKSDQGWKLMSRLKQELASYLQGAQLFENDRNGSYRVNAEIGDVNIEQLARSFSNDIRNVAAKIAKLQPERQMDVRPTSG